MAYFVGLDLGQSNDYTALAVVRRVGTGKRNAALRPETEYHLRHLGRYPLGMPYTEQADAVVRLMRSDALYEEERISYMYGYRRLPAKLTVDATGVGRAVTDLLKERGLHFRAITITGGDASKHRASSSTVPKRDLVAALEVPFHSGELKVAEGLKLWPVLRQELQNFRRKVSIKTGHDSYEHWRESDHDDLVLATALACWRAKRSFMHSPVPRAMAGYPKPPGF